MLAAKFTNKVVLFITYLIVVLLASALALPVLQQNSGYHNPFVGFYVFPHGGVTLDPANMDYSTQPAFNKPDSKEKAIKLHEAMKKAAVSLIDSKPDIIIFSTPHGYFLADNVLFVSSIGAAGDAGDIFSDFTASFQIDKDLSGIFYGELKGASDPVDILNLGNGYETLPLLWAEVIPWFFIREAAKKAGHGVPKAIYIGQPTRININDMTNVGRDIVKTVLLRKEFAQKRIAVVISGDLSHHHSHDPMAPYPFDPASVIFDKHIVDWAKLDRTSSNEAKSKELLLDKAGSIHEQAGHCGYSGLLVLHGMLEEVVNQNWNYKSNFYAYEVPSYFGMMVLGWTPAKWI